MPQYKLVSGIYFPGGDGGEGKTFSAGEVLDFSEEQAKPYLERGSIVKYDPNAPETSEKKPVAGVTEQEFSLGDNSYKVVRNGTGRHYLLNDEEVSEDAFTAAKQTQVKQAEDERVEAKHGDDTPSQEVQTSQETPLAPDDPNLNTPQQVTQQHIVEQQVTQSPVLTPEQLQAEFDATSSQPSNGSQQ